MQAIILLYKALCICKAVFNVSFSTSLLFMCCGLLDEFVVLTHFINFVNCQKLNETGFIRICDKYSV